MAMERQNYADGTSLVRDFGVFGSAFRGGRAKCQDGSVRTLVRISETADTFFSVPAAVKVQGRTVSGFITVDDTLNDPISVIRFTATGRNAGLLKD